jgi:phosphoribosylformylglycinamidine (FGAM) synthase PurS component
MPNDVTLKVTLTDAQTKTLARCLNRLSLTDFNVVASGKGQERDMEALSMREAVEVVRKALIESNQGLNLLW